MPLSLESPKSIIYIYIVLEITLTPRVRAGVAVDIAPKALRRL